MIYKKWFLAFDGVSQRFQRFLHATKSRFPVVGKYEKSQSAYLIFTGLAYLKTVPFRLGTKQHHCQKCGKSAYRPSSSFARHQP
mmetsp:Transcript_23178/g.34330  ORF Transcript_23178/g.34330 Transcript_23178/m.34330 type:complete len:84 (-) Transcript_23178:390-641(-)